MVIFLREFNVESWLNWCWRIKKLIGNVVNIERVFVGSSYYCYGWGDKVKMLGLLEFRSLEDGFLMVWDFCFLRGVFYWVGI